MTKAIDVNFWIVKNKQLKPKVFNGKVDYLAGIAQNNTRVMNLIYSNYLPTITNFVIQNNGTKDDALDVFQDGLIVICNKIKIKNFHLTSSFYTFFFSICRNIWLREVKKKYRQDKSINDLCETHFSFKTEKRCIEKENLLRSKMIFLSKESRQVLTLFFNGNSMKEIALEMNYTETYAQRKKYLAKNQLMKLVQKDCIYQELN